MHLAFLSSFFLLGIYYFKPFFFLKPLRTYFLNKLYAPVLGLSWNTGINRPIDLRGFFFSPCRSKQQYQSFWVWVVIVSRFGSLRWETGLGTGFGLWDHYYGKTFLESWLDVVQGSFYRDHPQNDQYYTPTPKVHPTTSYLPSSHQK